MKDADGVEVIATLYLDKDGSLFELDLWKTNFEPLLKNLKNMDSNPLAQ